MVALKNLLSISTKIKSITPICLYFLTFHNKFLIARQEQFLLEWYHYFLLYSIYFCRNDSIIYFQKNAYQKAFGKYSLISAPRGHLVFSKFLSYSIILFKVCIITPLSLCKCLLVNVLLFTPKRKKLSPLQVGLESYSISFVSSNLIRVMNQFIVRDRSFLR